MWTMIYPIAIIVVSNVLYNICTKSAPNGVNSFAMLTVTYLIAAAVSFGAFLISARNKNIFTECSKLNWTAFALGVVIVGLELGYLLAYRNGWQMNTVSVTANITLAVVLIVVAFLFYKESITLKQIAGMVLCAGGLVLINI